MTDAGRPQDQGRRHRRKGSPSAATASLLAQWHETLRAELQAVIRELEPELPDPGLGMVPVEAKRPKLSERVELVRLGVMVANALGTEVDRPPDKPAVQTGPARPRRRSRVDYG